MVQKEKTDEEIEYQSYVHVQDFIQVCCFILGGGKTVCMTLQNLVVLCMQ